MTGSFTLAGVIIGGLLNFLGTTWVEERRGRRAARTTARVIGAELSVNDEKLRAALDSGAWPKTEEQMFGFNAWEHYRHVLAERLSEVDWLQLESSIRRLQVLEREQAGEDPRTSLLFDRSELEAIRTSLETTIKMLRNCSA